MSKAEETIVIKDNNIKNLEKTKKPKVKKAHFIDKPKEPELVSQYLFQLDQLYETKKKFALYEFQKIRTTSNRTQIIDLFQRIGKVLNDVLPIALPKKEINNVCFIVVNSHINDIDYCGTGPFNDAYTIAKLHHNLNYEIFLLYNSTVEVFLQFFEYFLTYTKRHLTFYYSGHDAITVGIHGLYFLDKTKIFYDDLAKFVCDKCNGKSKILIISDCAQGGSIFDMNVVYYRKQTQPKKLSNIIVFSANKKDIKKKRDKILSHGLLTYLFCRLVKQNPNTTSWELVTALNHECLRFRETFNVDTSKRNLGFMVLFKKANQFFEVKKEKKEVKEVEIEYFEY